MGLAPILVIWSQQIRSYLRLNESLESNISQTFSKPVSIFLLFLKTILYTRSVGNSSSTSTRWIWEELHDCIFYPFISLFLVQNVESLSLRSKCRQGQEIGRKGKKRDWGESYISRSSRMLKRSIALAYPSQNYTRLTCKLKFD